MLADLARADVVFVGEQHDDPQHAPARARGARGADAPPACRGPRHGDVRARRAAGARRLPVGTIDRGAVPRRPRARGRGTRPTTAPSIEFARAHHIAGRRLERAAADRGRRRQRTALASLDALGADRAPRGARPAVPDERRLLRSLSRGDDRPHGVEHHAAAGRRARTIATFSRSASRTRRWGSRLRRRSRSPPASGDRRPLQRLVPQRLQRRGDARATRRLPGRRILVVSILPVDDIDAVTPATRPEAADYSSTP